MSSFFYDVSVMKGLKLRALMPNKFLIVVVFKRCFSPIDNFHVMHIMYAFCI